MLSNFSYSSDNFIVRVFGTLSNFDVKFEINEILNSLSEPGKLENVIKKIEDDFIIYVDDLVNKKKYIFSDRLGISPYYIGIDNNVILGHSCNADKALGCNVEENNINYDSIVSLCNNGYLLGDRTIFNNVFRIKPASILKFDYQGNIEIYRYYWKWGDIKRTNESITLDEASDVLYQKIKNQFVKKIDLNNPISITLSGGLDSRFLLAMANDIGHRKIKCFTFGDELSPDVKFAGMVCAVKNNEHEVIPIDKDNWFAGRVERIYRTAGMKNIMHMHGLSALESISQHSRTILNGYLGDLTLGGSYLKTNYKGNVVGLDSLIKYKYRSNSEGVNDNYDYFYCDSSDPCFIFNRGSRFTALGIKLVDDEIFGVKPFVFYDVLEYVYSLPDELRVNGKLYHHMLLKYYPEYFEEIPWQSTGKPISYSNESIFKFSYQSFMRIVKDIIRDSFLFGISLKLYNLIKGNSSFVDYEKLTNNEEFMKFESEIKKSSYYNRIINNSKLKTENMESYLMLLTVVSYLESIK
ncbi:asparagine synthase-related protein [Photobacterium sp. ZSDE20]|nr:asparagine synthase-related protein [Photobacterium sp. ZSDE20]